LIKAVVWSEFPIGTLPDEVRAAQLTSGDPGATYNTKGLRYMLKQRATHKGAYIDFVDRLAAEIVSAADNHNVPPLQQVPSLGAVRPMFGDEMSGPEASAPTAPLGPKHVCFIYVAADPRAFGSARPHDAYVDSGAGDWRPFFPVDTVRVHQRLQNIASGEGLDFTSEEVPFGNDLILRIEQAWDRRQLVVLVVDAWSVHWDAQEPRPQFVPLLKKLDARFDYHWCVLVPWNDSDPVAEAKREEITGTVRLAFDRHARLAPNPLFYREGIRSLTSLRSAVTDVLTRLKEEVKRHAPVQRQMPPGPGHTIVRGPTT
jgi:FxsC-like protein